MTGAPPFFYIYFNLRAQLTKRNGTKRTGNSRGQLAGIRNHRGRMAGKGVIVINNKKTTDNNKKQQENINLIILFSYICSV